MDLNIYIEVHGTYMQLNEGPMYVPEYVHICALDLNICTLDLNIWVSFCRAGKMAVSRHFFFKSRALVWLNRKR